MNKQSAMSGSICVLIVDDNALVRKAMRAFLDSRPGIDVVGEASDGSEAVSEARALRPDIILMDLAMPRMGGEEAIREITSENSQVCVLLFTNCVDGRRILRAIRAGSAGYFPKGTSVQELTQLIRKVHRGEMSLHPVVARALLYEVEQPSGLLLAEEPLSELETKVLRLATQGLSDQEIGQRLSIGGEIVHSCVRSILSKLHSADRFS